VPTFALFQEGSSAYRKIESITWTVCWPREPECILDSEVSMPPFMTAQTAAALISLSKHMLQIETGTEG